MHVGRSAVLLLAALTLAVIPACSSSSSGDTDGRLRVVASTDVYANIVSAIAGNHVEVTSLIDAPDQDPHSYEANARSQLAISKADVLVENGGGYDDFMDRLRSASGKPGVSVINVVQLSGKTAPAGGDLNEHVFYDFPTIAKLTARLVAVLSQRDPDDRAAFRAHAATFTGHLAALEHAEAAIRARAGGAGVAITEPVPLYLLQACGLVNKTPQQFSEAVEDGTDVSAAVLQRTLALFSGNAVVALVYNSQTSGAETTKVLAAAKANGIAAVPVTETLPAGQTYLEWMTANLGAVRAAVTP